MGMISHFYTQLLHFIPTRALWNVEVTSHILYSPDKVTSVSYKEVSSKSKLHGSFGVGNVRLSRHFHPADMG